jgi:hypothetical protein
LTEAFRRDSNPVIAVLKSLFLKEDSAAEYAAVGSADAAAGAGSALAGGAEASLSLVSSSAFLAVRLLF